MTPPSPKLAVVAALEREISGLLHNCVRVDREYQGRTFRFYEGHEIVAVCGGIGLDAARHAAEAVIAFYHPPLLQSVGFAGALDPALHVGDIFIPAAVIDARDGSRIEIEAAPGKATLISFMAVADAAQKTKLSQSYSAQAIDMEAAAVAAAARAHGIRFAAIKVISDELNFEMPDLSRFVGQHGRFRTASFAFYASIRPWLWTRIAALARNSNEAQKALSNHLVHFRSQPKDRVEANIT